MLNDAPALPAGGAFCIAGSFATSRASGADARAFLNGQLSSDVKTLAASRWQLSSYSTPKGRALATFVVAAQADPRGDTFWLVTRRSVAAATFKRLGMFVLRSKVIWAHETHVAIGICGTAGATALAALLGDEPPAQGVCGAVGADTPLGRMLAEAHSTTVDAPTAAVPAGSLAGELSADSAGASVLGLGDTAWWLLVPVAVVPTVATALSASLPEVGAARWDAVEIAAGRPWVEAGTVESFVPQMLNLDLTGGISFKKGCYPGQEIVARTQYLGKVKRRMLRFALDLGTDADPPAPGTAVHIAGDSGQAVGEVVLAAPLEAGQAQLLAVLQMDLAAGADLCLGAAGGPALRPLPLPYALDAA